MAACGLLTFWKIAQTSQLELEIESKLENALFLSATISLLMRPRGLKPQFVALIHFFRYE